MFIFSLLLHFLLDITESEFRDEQCGNHLHKHATVFGSCMHSCFLCEMRQIFLAPALLKINGFRVHVPGNDILALDEVQTVLYTHMVITRFLYRSAGLNERQSLPKKAKVAAI